jgi:hypothetical protein
VMLTVWIQVQVLALAGQVLYHFSNNPIPLCHRYFSNSVLCLCPAGLHCDPFIYASCRGGMTGTHTILSGFVETGVSLTFGLASLILWSSWSLPLKLLGL